MLIKYQPNPLCAIVELDAQEIEILRLKVTIEELEERIWDAHFHLDPGDRLDPGAARKSLGAEALDDDMKARVQELLGHYIDALRGPHGGDCTCVPCSCTKCHAEGLLGIDTIAGLGKHSAHSVDGAFSEGRDLDGAIAYLSDYKPARTGGFDRHIPRWAEEAKRAAEWLKNYQQNIYLPAPAGSPATPQEPQS